MKNQRAEERKKFMAFTPVYDVNHKILLGYIGDLTPKGAMVIGEKPLDLNQQITLGVEFPDALPVDLPARILLPARVAWCRTDDTPNMFSVGFEFAELSPENAKVIEAVLKRYQFRHPLSISNK